MSEDRGRSDAPHPRPFSQREKGEGHLAEVLRGRARAGRKDMGLAEKIVWDLVRDRRFQGLRFVRQKIVRPYIVDFYCHELRLALEIDGPVHDTPEARQYDAVRTRELARQGIRVARVTTDDVLRGILPDIHKTHG